MFESRFASTGALDDLGTAVAAARVAAGDRAAGADLGEQRRAVRLARLLLAWCQRIGAAPEMLAESERIIRSRLADAEPAGAERAGLTSELADLMRVRYDTSGRIADLDEAIALGREAVALRPSADGRSYCLAVLSMSLRMRFAYHGAPEDLEAAVEAGRRAVTESEAAGEPPERRSERRAALAEALAERAAELDRPADLDEAIDQLRDALRDQPATHVDRLVLLSNLGGKLMQRYRRRGDERDADDAVATLRTGLAAAAGSAWWAGLALNLAFALIMRDPTATNPALDEAIGLAGQAADRLAADHPQRAPALRDHAAFLMLRYARDARGDDQASALERLREASALPGASPRQRLQAAVVAGDIAHARGEGPDAAALLARAVAELPLVAWVGLDRRVQERHLATEAVGVAGHAAAAQVEAGDAAASVTVLEQGRAVLWTHQLHRRSDLGRLREEAPDLADRLDRVRRHLDARGGGDRSAG
ncbi:hypothetical protein [Dactylosporangium sp. CA-139066]|uniref:hypothetical protein n=1 Tax=Dactylosporangium sp. CA-139066 TaxID=3239930 RepID=UPI003D9242AF